MIQIHDLDLLRKTVAGFGGLKWNEGSTTFKSYGQTGKTKSEHGTCEHSITMEGEHYYDIGVIKRKDGQGWSLAFDEADHYLKDKVGSGSSKLICAYEVTYIRDFAERNGFMIDQRVDSEGNVEMVLTSSN
jgi:hypothetical protein